MTVLDKSVEHVGVLMVLPRGHAPKSEPLHEDYHYRKYDDDLYEAWAALMDKTGLASKDEAYSILDKMLEDREAFTDNFLFVVDDAGNLAATAGIWPGHVFEDRLRLHWVAVDPDHQRKGLARSMITELAQMYEGRPGRYPLYLSTQSESWPAIMLYSRLGFTPYLGAYEGHTEEQSQQDWEKVTQLLREKSQK